MLIHTLATTLTQDEVRRAAGKSVISALASYFDVSPDHVERALIKAIGKEKMRFGIDTETDENSRSYRSTGRRTFVSDGF